VTDLRLEVIDLVKKYGLRHAETPFRLSSGESSNDYIDGKTAVSSGQRLRLVAQAILDLVAKRRVVFDAVGGLTMGADALSHGVALVGDKQWFTVRKERKEHGQGSLIEGADVAGMRILLVDDIVTTGKSILRALEAIEEADGQVVMAVALVDRATRTESLLSAKGVPFDSLLTYRDLGILPVGDGGRVPA
jgi:orotate phosphoribosyltransferase